MLLQIESTSKIVHLNGVPARLWEGVTDTGIPVHCFITRVALANDQSADVHKQFEGELQECRAPSPDVAAIPPHLIL